jgi:hypothetical protein
MIHINYKYWNLDGTWLTVNQQMIIHFVLFEISKQGE